MDSPFGYGGVICSLLLLSLGTEAAEVSFSEEQGSITVLRVGTPFATYRYDDTTILRPYFHSVYAPNGVQVTRNHPPMPETDATDHADMHPGIWTAFGDINGVDFWRNKGRVRARIDLRSISRRFEYGAEPGSTGIGQLLVENTYQSDSKTICTEKCRYTVETKEYGTLLIAESEFIPTSASIVFGDQEEMGFGIRMATPLTVKSGIGRMLDSDGNENEAGVRGSTARWVDYSAEVDGERVGVLLMPSPKNFRPSWYHARDYGLLVANPFGRNALTGGETSRVEVAPGESLTMKFAVFVYAVPVQNATRTFYESCYQGFVTHPFTG